MRHPLAALALAILALAGCAGRGDDRPASSAGRPLPQLELQRLVEEVRQLMEAPGAILGVARGEGPVDVVASGLADRDAGRSMSPDDPCYLGSISKTYTAVVILRLAEEGRLSLDDPLTR